MRKTLRIMVLASALSASCAVMALANVQLQPNQSDRWNVDDSGTWRLQNEAKTSYVLDSWFQDLDGEWYMLGSDNNGAMYSGLITDRSTGKSYYLNVNHDGYYGKLMSQNGKYTVNGIEVYLTFNQAHDGTFGAITSGLDDLRNTGVNKKELDRIPVETTQPAPTQPAPPETTESNQSTVPYSNVPDMGDIGGNSGGFQAITEDASGAGGGGADISNININ